MANKPIVPEPGFSFADFSTNYPLQQQPGNELDDEYAQLRQTDRELIAWLEQSIDDDGRLAYQVVDPRNFSATSLLLIDSGWLYRGEWAALTTYAVGDYVVISADQASYICVEAHTSGADFPTDYASGYWGLLFQAGAGGDVFGPPGSSANEVTVYQDSTGKLIGNSGVQLSALARRNADNYLQGFQYLGAAGSEEAVLAALSTDAGAYLARIRPGVPYDFADGAVVVTDGEVQLFGASLQVAALAGGDGYQVYATADGYLYPVAPPDPGWSVSDTDAGSYATGTGTGLGPWVQFTGLEITVPEDVGTDDRLIYQIVTQLQNVTTNRTGSVAVGVGIDGAAPTGSGVQHIITPGFDGAVITGVSTENQTLPGGTVLSVWFRRVSGDHAQFGVTADGSSDPHSLLVEKGAAGGGGPGGGVSGPGTSTAGAVATWAGTTGDLLADSSKLTAQLPQLNGINTFTGPANEFNNPVTQAGEQLIRTDSASPPTGVKPVFDIIQCTQAHYDGITPDANTLYLIPGVEAAQELVYLGSFAPAAGEIRLESVLTGFVKYLLLFDSLSIDGAGTGPRMEFMVDAVPDQNALYTFTAFGARAAQDLMSTADSVRFNLAGTVGIAAGVASLDATLMLSGLDDAGQLASIDGTVTMRASATAAYAGIFGGHHNSATIFNGLRVYAVADSITAGSIHAYGIRGS